MNIPLTALLTLNALLMIVLPLGLGIYLARRLGVSWRLWGIGAATFVLSQVGHIPFNALFTRLFSSGALPKPPDEYALLFSALFLGLSSGLWEETFRYGAYRWWAKDARTWPQGLMLGAGHGGIEAIILGVLAFIALVNMIALNGADLARLLPAEQVPLVQQQVAAYWATPWYLAVLGAVERVFAILFHLTASLIVLQVFLRKQIRWLWLAVLWHATLNAVAILASAYGPLAAEAALAGLSVVNLVLLVVLCRNSPAQLPPPNVATAGVDETAASPGTAEAPDAVVEPPETAEDLDASRFMG
jgi:uncharacterized membrane protein YhfC